MKKFNLELHPEKTRLLVFGPVAIDQRQWREEGKPEMFNFLGFTHICVKKKSKGRFRVLRQTWHRALSRRSPNGRVLWDCMQRLIHRWLPLPSVCHPYPLRRMGVVT
jgi:RNA-directed DNA polymerase